MGLYNKDTVLDMSKGNSSLATHMREGVVVKPMVERKDVELGLYVKTFRKYVILKSVSDAYLLRKNKNATEYA